MQKDKKSCQENQRDIRTCFLEGMQSKKKGTKRKTRAYYQQGFSKISDTSDAEFKPAHKRSKKVNAIGNKEIGDAQSHCVPLIVDSDDDISLGSGEKPFVSDVCLASKTEISVQELREVRNSNSDVQFGPVDDFCHPDAIQKGDKYGFANNKKVIKTMAESSTDLSKQLEDAYKISYAMSQNVINNIEDTEERCQDMADADIGSKIDDNINDNIDVVESVSCESKSPSSVPASVEIPLKSSIPSSIPEAAIVYRGSTDDDSHEHFSTGVLSVSQAFAFDATVMHRTSDSTDNTLTSVGAASTLLKSDEGRACVNNHVASNGSSPHEIIDSEDIAGRWSCSACTFDNHGDLSFCEICETVRPVERVRTRSDTCPLIAAITPKKRTKNKEYGVKLKESDDESRTNTQSEVESSTSSHDVPGIKQIVNKLSDCIDGEPLKNTGSEAVENTGNQTVAVSNSIDTNFEDKEKQRLKFRNRNEQISFSDDVSVISDSSSDVEEDWIGTESKCKSENIDCLNSTENSSVSLIRSQCSDAMNSNFCVADAFSKGSSVPCNSLPVPQDSDEESTLSLEGEYIALVDSPLLFDPHDSMDDSIAENRYTSVDGRELDVTKDNISAKSDLFGVSSNNAHTGTLEQDDKEVLMSNEATQSEVISGMCFSSCI